MASPQLEDGYTRIANEILEAVYSADLNGTQLKIVLCIWRFTYGFQRKEHGLSESFISNAISRHKNQVAPEMQKLISRKIILVKKEATFTKPRVLAFNKYYEQWEQKGVQSVNILTPSELTNCTVSKFTDTPVSESTDTPVSEFTYQEKKVLKKDIKEKNKDNIVSKDTIRSTEVQRIIVEWNQLGIKPIRDISAGTIRYKLLSARIKKYGIDTIVEAIHCIRESPFLQGQNNKGWMITFDWFVKPNNFIKVLEGNYNQSVNNNDLEDWING